MGDHSVLLSFFAARPQGMVQAVQFGYQNRLKEGGFFGIVKVLKFQQSNASTLSRSVLGVKITSPSSLIERNPPLLYKIGFCCLMSLGCLVDYCWATSEGNPE
jgi:hypothetical protein